MARDLPGGKRGRLPGTLRWIRSWWAFPAGCGWCSRNSCSGYPHRPGPRPPRWRGGWPAPPVTQMCIRDRSKAIFPPPPAHTTTRGDSARGGMEMGKAKRRAVCAFAAGALVAAGVVARAAAMLPGTVYVAKGEGLQLSLIHISGWTAIWTACLSRRR